MARKVRLDRLLVQRGLAATVEEAEDLIGRGRVLVDGLVAHKGATQVDRGRPLRVQDEGHRWVGRGALKLLGAVEALGIDPRGWVCADLGASTGGFTEVLVRSGAARVYAIDVGRGLLHRRLEVNERVVVMDGVNARYLYVDGEPPDAERSTRLPERCDLVVGDLSFIGLDQVVDAVERVLKGDGRAVLLVKPQFEVDRGQLGDGGLVDDPVARSEAIARVRSLAEERGLACLGGVDSSVPGARAGNVEHFLHLGRTTK